MSLPLHGTGDEMSGGRLMLHASVMLLGAVCVLLLAGGYRLRMGMGHISLLFVAAGLRVLV